MHAEEEVTVWSERIPPRSSKHLNLPEGYAIEITRIGLVDAPAGNFGNVEVTAKVKTLVCCSRTDGHDDEPAYHEQIVSLCTIDTAQGRDAAVSILFTPLNIVEVINPCDAHIELTGAIDELDADLEEEEEEEDTNESLPVDEIQARFRQMAENPPPQPAPQPRKQRRRRSSAATPEEEANNE